jgi:hypothetical protein
VVTPRTPFSMGMLDVIASQVAAGATIDFRPRGSSTAPPIEIVS